MLSRFVVIGKRISVDTIIMIHGLINIRSNCLFDALLCTLHCDVCTLNSVAGSTFSLFCASLITLLPNSVACLIHITL